MPGDLCTVPSIISLSPLSLADRRDTWGKWPLARNPDRSWWHHHTTLKLVWPQPMAPWITGQARDLEVRGSNFSLEISNCTKKYYYKFEHFSTVATSISSKQALPKAFSYGIMYVIHQISQLTKCKWALTSWSSPLKVDFFIMTRYLYLK